MGGGREEGGHGPWAYEPDENPKRKHAWEEAEAGFVSDAQGNLVGKCPCDLTNERATELLATAIPYSPSHWTRPYPQRLYVVDRGVVFRATPTVPGRSYHGFPEHPERFPRSPELREGILQRARELGCESEVRLWMEW